MCDGLQVRGSVLQVWAKPWRQVKVLQNTIVCLAKHSLPFNHPARAIGVGRGTKRRKGYVWECTVVVSCPSASLGSHEMNVTVYPRL
jgi:hypothetical protein